MSNLPPAWEQVPLASITGDASQRVPPADEQFTYIDIGSLDRDSKTIMAPQRLLGADAPSRARKQVRCGDTLVSMTRPNLNAVALVPPELDGQIASTGFDVLRPLEGIDPRWIAYLVRIEAFVEAMSSAVQGALYPAVRSKDVRAYQVPLAPSAEQTRIADQLDKLLARIQACNDRIDAIPALLKRFRQSVLAAATSGKLTEDWRAERVDHVNPEVEFENVARDSAQLRYPVVAPEVAVLHQSCDTGWSKMPIGELITGIEAGINVQCEERPPEAGEFGLIKISAVTWGKYNEDESKTLPKGKHVPDATRIRIGDFLISRANTLELVGACVIVHDVTRPLFLSDKVLRLVMPDSLKPWLLYALRSEQGRTQIESLSSGNQLSMRNLSQSNLRKILIPLPPENERDEIVRRVEALFQLADRIEARYTATRAQAQRLTPLLLAKAFRGELVPQDSSDEPASELLQRIAAAQSAKTPPPRGRPRAQPKAPPAPPVPKPTDWTSLPNGAWAAPEDPDGLAAMVWLTAVLRAWGESMPEREARLATLLCQQPRLFTAVLPAVQAASWSRLIGDEARPLPTQLLHFQPAINAHWGRVIKGMRARGDLVEAGFGDDITWALGPGAADIETAGWADGRAGFVVAYLRAHGIASVLPLLESSAQEFVYAKAA